MLWRTSILPPFATASLRQVYVYHGPSRNRDRAFLASHDVVISTYSMLGSDLHDKARGLLSVPWLRECGAGAEQRRASVLHAGRGGGLRCCKQEEAWPTRMVWPQQSPASAITALLLWWFGGHVAPPPPPGTMRGSTAPKHRAMSPAALRIPR